MAINQNDKVIRQIMVGDKAHEIGAKYLNDHTYDEIKQDIRDSCDEIRNNLLSPIYYYSNPKLDIKDETNNVYCYGYVGLLKNINVYGDYILIDSISVYVRENDNIENLDTPVWCRLLKFVNNTWETVYQSTESKTIRGIAPETLFSFKMRAIDDTNDTNKLIRSTDKIAIVYVNSEDAQVLSGVRLGFKAILNTGGGLQNPLANNSGGNPSWCPAFTIGYLTDAPINPGETFEGSININNGDLNIKNKTTISSEIDSGELKVRHYGTTKGFIIRTNNKDENANSDIFPLEILTTNNSYSYQYNFPKSNGDVLLYKKVTYSELVGLKNNSQLVPGGVYRISDYEAYTAAGSTSSAGHQFDILVVAISNNKLSENAKVCLHDGDTYFRTNGAKLESWEIKYCIDNDDSRFQWINGTDTIRKGVIYYMKDEWGNEAPYDFKNILFNKKGVNYYTFSFSNNGSIEDATVTTKNVYNNKILPFYDLGDKNMVLNHNTFLLTNINQHLCVSNYIGQNCKNNTFGSNCICNTLESYCNKNTFGDNCMCNTLESYSEYNTFGNNCQYNEFGEYCTDNTFGDYCQSNVFGVSCTYNKFGSYILRCNIGNKCSYCKITNNDGDNGVLLSYVKMIEFGDECSNVNLWTDNTDSGYVQNYKITNGLSGSIKITGDNIRGRNYQTIISKNVYGDIVQFVLSADTVIQNILYSDLKYLCDNNKLMPGQKYRIIDYVTTTSQENTQSAGHQFDIIVEALSENTLSENAKAIQNENDGYFDEANLEAWELKYCLDNDISRFAWADDNGKGVIYYMKDEFNNECPYDFKNIQFVRYKLNPPTVGGYSDECENKLSENVNKMFENNQLSYIWHGSNSGGHYWENENSDDVFSTATGETKAFYTFSNVNNDEITDDSLNSICYSNVIKEYYENKVLKLNNNIFFLENINNYCYFNSFGNNCRSNSFGNHCYSNSFGNHCDYNSFGTSCYLNSFGNDCYSNSFGNSCSSNSFGNTHYYNSFGNYCCANSFGNDCYSNSFGNDCYSNSFGNSCNFNSFGNDCDSNSFGNECDYNSFGDYCDYNSFGNDCDYNSFGNNCKSNNFGDSCDHNSFVESCDFNSFGNNSHSNSFGNYSHSNSFGNYCNYNSFGDTCRVNIFGNYCHGNSFGEGFYSNTFGNNCYSNSFGNVCQSNTFGNNCYSIGFYAGASINTQGNSGYVVTSEKLDYVKNITISEGCSNLLLYTTITTNSSNYVQNITITKNVRAISSDGDRLYPLTILISDVNNEYEIKIAKDSSGKLKMYCEADLIQ